MVSRDFETFSILSWKVGGLNSKFKRALLFQYVKSHNSHILILQETHLMGSKLMALKWPWVLKAFHASYFTYTREVSILVNKSLPYVIEAVHTDPQGKYVNLVTLFWQQQYVFVGIYIPPPFQPATLLQILVEIAPYCPTKLLPLGDFNAVLSLDLDRPVSTRSSTRDLLKGALSTGLTEAWRWKNPTTRAYSCFSTSYKTPPESTLLSQIRLC